MAGGTRERSGTTGATGSRPQCHRRRENSGSRPSASECRPVFAKAPVAILIVDRQGRCVEANAAASKLTGYTCDELLAMSMRDLKISSGTGDAPGHRNELLKIGESAGPATLARRDGEKIAVEVQAIALGDGIYQYIVHDIADRSVAGPAGRQPADCSSAHIQLCHAPVISAGPTGRVTFWNAAAEELFGYTAEEAIGSSITKLIPAGLKRKHLALYRRHAQRADDGRFTRVIRVDGLHKDGRGIPVELRIAVGRQDSTTVFTAVVRDMTEDQLVVDRLNDANQRLQVHIERMPLAYIVWDGDLRVVEWNPSAERMFGYTQDEALGMHARKLLLLPDADATGDRECEDLLCGDGVPSSLQDNVRKDGSRLTCEWFNTSLRDAGGRITGARSLAMDVSEREIMESQIRDAQKLESLGVLAAGVAHDFNSALMIILGNTSLLRSLKGLPAEALGHIELIEEASFRASEFIKHLLAYARTGRHNPQSTDLQDVIQDTVSFVRSSFGARHDIELSLDEGLPTILADRSQLEQLILNLCLNAKQACPQGGVINIQTGRSRLNAKQRSQCIPPYAKPGNYVEMVVTDTGCGMDEVTMQRIFDPFFTTKEEGHGLGLAASLGILRQHNAFVLVESKVKKGTKMHVFFPTYRAKSHAPSGRAAKSTQRKRKTAT